MVLRGREGIIKEFGHVSAVQWLSRVGLFAIPWTAAH